MRSGLGELEMVCECDPAAGRSFPGQSRIFPNSGSVLRETGDRTDAGVFAHGTRDAARTECTVFPAPNRWDSGAIWIRRGGTCVALFGGMLAVDSALNLLASLGHA